MELCVSSASVSVAWSVVAIMLANFNSLPPVVVYAFISLVVFCLAILLLRVNTAYAVFVLLVDLHRHFCLLVFLCTLLFRVNSAYAVLVLLVDFVDLVEFCL